MDSSVQSRAARQFCCLGLSKRNVRILIIGATGFIGRALATELRRRGHQVVAASRQPASQAETLQVDFAQVPPASWWLPRLAGIDAVVNAVGILREQRDQRFDALHTHAPVELFLACVAARVGIVIQVSALGADEHAQSRYHLSKRAADEVLRTLALRGAIVQPSLVYDLGGESAGLFNKLASLPVLALPRRGQVQVQPVHLSDVVDGIAALLEAPPPSIQTIAFAGPQPLSLREYLARLRKVLGWGRALVLPFPQALFVAMASVAGRVPGSFLDRETAGMLLRGNTAPAGPLQRLLGHPARPVEAFLDKEQALAARTCAALAIFLPLLRLGLALLWLWTAAVSLGLYPVQESYALLARVGLVGALATVALYSAALIDLALGVATLAAPARWRRWVWAAQLALIAGYTVLISLFLPEYWLHPYGPISKNIPIIAAIALLWALEPPSRRR
ncbi:MAG: hypothetical protein JWQ13_2172 [Ramlibacter sp.]|nr:hypothetical protein [Ramlibacter sp.]